MPTLSTIDADTLNLDHFYTNYPNSYGVAFDEENPSNTCSIPASLKPIDCITKTLHSNTKITHFIKAPSTTAIVFCLCDKYYTNFISSDNSTLNSMKKTTDFTPFTANLSNKKTKAFLQDLNKITQYILLFLILIFHEYTCKKY